MREIRLYGSEGGAAGVTTGRPYPYWGGVAKASNVNRSRRREISKL